MGFPMADCPSLPRCPFFNDAMADMPAVANLTKRRLCQGDHAGCARYVVLQALGREAVPPDLWPDQTDRARQIVDATILA
jgi:hypothetical protein